MNTQTKTHKLKKSRFLTWYFQDLSDTLQIGNRVKNCLDTDNEFTITTQELLDSCCELPSYIMIGYQEQQDFDDNWITPDLIELVD